MYFVCLFLAKEFSIEDPLFKEIVCEKFAGFFFHFLGHHLFNKPFPSYLFTLCQTESLCKTSHMVMCFAYRLALIQSKHIFKRKVLHKAS